MKTLFENIFFFQLFFIYLLFHEKKTQKIVKTQEKSQFHLTQFFSMESNRIAIKQKLPLQKPRLKLVLFLHQIDSAGRD